MKTKGKFVSTDKGRVFECQLKAVGFAGNRFELIAVYQAAKKVFGASAELKEIVDACKVKQKELDNAKR